MSQEFGDMDDLNIPGRFVNCFSFNERIRSSSLTSFLVGLSAYYAFIKIFRRLVSSPAACPVANNLEAISPVP